MYKIYIDYYKQYTEIYGPDTAIFLMVGSFYELYDIENIETGETICNLHTIIDHLGIQLKTKEIVEKTPTKKKEEDLIIPYKHNKLFSGFPDYVLHKWAGRLTSVGWNVIVIDQVKDVKGKVISRKVARILSPSTHIENIPSAITPYVVSIHFNVIGINVPKFGIAALDLTTGTTITYSGTCIGSSLSEWMASDIVQFLDIYQPKEIIIHTSYKKDIPNESFFRKVLDISSNIKIHLNVTETAAFSKDLFRNEYFQKIYSIKSILPPKVYLGLRTENEELSLLYLLQFVEEHYAGMLKSFHRNEPWVPEMRLICGNHALTQLQLTSNDNDSVINLFDKCITSMGKRAIRERLLTPYSRAENIIKRLDEVQDYDTWSNDKTKLLYAQLKFISDIPRLHRKLLCGVITFSEINLLFKTYKAVKIIITKITENTLLTSPFTIKEFNEYLKVFNQHFVEGKDAEETTIFNIDTYPKIGGKETDILSTIQDIQNLRLNIASLAKINEELIKLEKKDDGYGFKCTVAGISKIKLINKENSAVISGLKIKELASCGWIDCTQLHNLNVRLANLINQLQHLTKIHLIDACQEISNIGKNIWRDMQYWVSHIDCTQCISRVSKEKGFVCPKIIPSLEDEGSSIDIKQIRHPLVENSATRVSYVKHNISLNNNTKGWLVYGINASGKSTLMKAVGICVLLAQAGCFVPCQEMTLTPFRSIYTRILNQDNLSAGLSSFAVEMTQLREIDNKADKYTLVLGDELCSGTESTSAESLVASGVETLSERNSKFIFATHLHHLPEIIDVKSLNVEVWHIHVERDLITNKLIYDRTLKSGKGSALYGLEVAKAMDLSDEFINKAIKYRNLILGNNNGSVSSWNREIVKRECEICGKRISSKLEVHHIQERSTAINNILPDGTHMNNKQNLIVICDECHNSTHNKNITIGGLKITSDGPEREIIKSSQNIKRIYP